MNQSDIYYHIKPNILFCIAVPMFMMLFAVLYSPTFGMKTNLWTYGWQASTSLCLAVLCAIELVVLAISRTLLCLPLSRRNLSLREFIVWMVTEIVVSSLFFNLFISLYVHDNYFGTLPKVLLVSLCVLFIPYLVYLLIMELLARDQRIRVLEKQVETLSQNAEQQDSVMLRFADEKGMVKLVVESDKVISLESGGNYVIILYDAGGKLMRYSVRTTLKALEEVCQRGGLVRCHRSYYVNLARVRTIRRTPQGTVAEIDYPGVDNVPVSRAYASELVKLLQ